MESTYRDANLLRAIDISTNEDINSWALNILEWSKQALNQWGNRENFPNLTLERYRMNRRIALLVVSIDGEGTRKVDAMPYRDHLEDDGNVETLGY